MVERSPGSDRFSGSAFPSAVSKEALAFIGFILLLTLSLESVPIPIQAQILPLTSILALIFLPVVMVRIHATPLFKVVILFAVFTLLHSVVALFVDVAVLGAGHVRILAWARQVAALVMGLSVFLVLRRSLVNMSDRFILCAITGGALLALVVASLNVIWGLTGSRLLGGLVVSVRSFLTKGHSYPARATGLSFEPAHFALFLATIVLPVIVAGLLTSKRRAPWLLVLTCTTVTFMWTESTVGLIVLIGMVVGGALLGVRRPALLLALVGLLTAAVNLTPLYSASRPSYPESYASYQTGSLLAGSWTVSAVDRYYSTVGPFLKSLSSYTLFGYGLGGTSTHFAELVPETARAAIASVRWQEMPNLANLLGRIFGETGLLGLVLFLAIFMVCLKELNHLARHSTGRSRTIFLGAVRLALIGCFLTATIGGYGSFALPFIWLWLAVVDSRYVRETALGGQRGDYASS